MASSYARAAEPNAEACVSRDVECARQGESEPFKEYCARIESAKAAGNPGYAQAYCRFDSFGRLQAFSSRFVPETERPRPQSGGSRFVHLQDADGSTFGAEHYVNPEAQAGAPIAETVSGLIKLEMLANRDLIEMCVPKQLATIPAGANAGDIALETLNSAINAAGLIDIGRGAGHAEPVELIAIRERIPQAKNRLAQTRPELLPTFERVTTELGGGDALAAGKREALERAHLVGNKAQGAYTKPELAEKVRILIAGGFTRTEREAILRSGLAGIDSRVAEMPSDTAEEVPSISGDLDALRAKEEELKANEAKKAATPAWAPHPQALAYDDQVDTLADEVALYLKAKQAGTAPKQATGYTALLKMGEKSVRELVLADKKVRDDRVKLGMKVWDNALIGNAICSAAVGLCMSLVSHDTNSNIMTVAATLTTMAAGGVVGGLRAAKGVRVKAEQRFWDRLKAHGLEVPETGRDEWLDRSLKDLTHREDQISDSPQLIASEVERYRQTLRNLGQLMQDAHRPAAKAVLDAMADKLPGTTLPARVLAGEDWRKSALASLAGSKMTLRMNASSLGINDAGVNLEELLDPPFVRVEAQSEQHANPLTYISPSDTLSRTILLKVAENAMHEHILNAEEATFSAQLIPAILPGALNPLGITRIDAVLTVKKNGQTISIPIASEFTTRNRDAAPMIQGDEWARDFAQAFHKAVDGSFELHVLGAAR